VTRLPFAARYDMLQKTTDLIRLNDIEGRTKHFAPLVKAAPMVRAMLNDRLDFPVDGLILSRDDLSTEPGRSEASLKWKFSNTVDLYVGEKDKRVALMVSYKGQHVVPASTPPLVFLGKAPAKGTLVECDLRLEPGVPPAEPGRPVLPPRLPSDKVVLCSFVRERTDKASANPEFVLKDTLASLAEGIDRRFVADLCDRLYIPAFEPPRARPSSPPRARPSSPPRARPSSPPRARPSSPPRARPSSPPHSPKRARRDPPETP
jgi:hypothetical protein